jgi:hypothetical protein
MSETLNAENNGEGFGFFFNSDNGDRLYDANSFEKWLKKFFTTGVFTGDLQVIADNAMTVHVLTGYANVEGKVRLFGGNTTGLVIETAHATYDRIDTVVIERNDTERRIYIKVVKGGYSSVPEPTAPVRSAGIYQLVLAEIYVAAGATSITQSVITDKRADSDVCGYVITPVDVFDFDQFATQFEAYLAEFKANSAADFTEWENTQKSDFEGWEQDQKDAYDVWEAAAEAAFTSWFAGIQDTLDGDTAGHLLNLINLINDGQNKPTQNSVTTYNGDHSSTSWQDGKHLETEYNGTVVTEQMYDQNNNILWTKRRTYNGNVVSDTIEEGD